MDYVGTLVLTFYTLLLASSWFILQFYSVE